MNRQQRPVAALALIAIVAAISACGSSAPAQTAGGASTSVTSSAQRAVKFAKCMRSNGVGEFPDPGASGKLTIDGIVNGSSLDPNAPAFKEAISACRDLEPAGFMGAKRSARGMEAALKFAQCMRANGVKDFPDPINGQPLVDTNRIPSSASPAGMGILNAAMRRCGSFVPAANR